MDKAEFTLELGYFAKTNPNYGRQFDFKDKDILRSWYEAFGKTDRWVFKQALAKLTRESTAYPSQAEVALYVIPAHERWLESNSHPKLQLSPQRIDLNDLPPIEGDGIVDQMFRRMMDIALTRTNEEETKLKLVLPAG